MFLSAVSSGFSLVLEVEWEGRLGVFVRNLCTMKAEY